MALAVAFDDAKVNQIKRDRGGKDTIGRVMRTPFIGSRDNPNMPLATLNQHEPGTFSSAHFHIRDQFQVIVEGEGKLGRHDIAPYSVHFSRAYTPYGPLRSDPGKGMSFFVMRAHPETGSQHLPEQQEQLDRVPNRDPWQITRTATFPPLPSGPGTAETLLQPVPEIKDDRGLAAYTLSMKPNAKTTTPDPSRSEGQYLVVVKGSLLHDGKEYKAFALIFVWPHEGPFQVQTGPAGVEMLVLNFPRPKEQATSTTPNIHAKLGFKVWQCALCSFTYNEAAGMPEEGIAPGTRWEDVPETWNCPDCSASKADFQMVEV